MENWYDNLNPKAVNRKAAARIEILGRRLVSIYYSDQDLSNRYRFLGFQLGAYMVELAEEMKATSGFTFHLNAIYRVRAAAEVCYDMTNSLSLAAMGMFELEHIRKHGTEELVLDARGILDDIVTYLGQSPRDWTGFQSWAKKTVFNMQG